MRRQHFRRTAVVSTVLASSLVSCTVKGTPVPAAQSCLKQYDDLSPGTNKQGAYKNSLAEIDRATGSITIQTEIDPQSPTPPGVTSMPHHFGDVVYCDTENLYGTLQVRAAFPKQFDAQGRAMNIGKPVLMWWPNNDDWPAGVEIDFAEVFDPYRKVGQVNIHYQDTTGHQVISSEFTGDLSTFNNYDVEWKPDSLRILFNGKTVVLIVGRATGERNEFVALDAIPKTPHRPTFQVDAAGATGDDSAYARGTGLIIERATYTQLGATTPQLIR